MEVPSRDMIKVIPAYKYDGVGIIKWRSTVKKLKDTLDIGYFNETFYAKIKGLRDEEIIIMVV